MKQCLMEQLAFGSDNEESFEASGVEYENEIYLRGYDIDEIKAKASSYEGQEQWGIFVPKTPQNASSGSLRVRRTDCPDGRTIYEDACKTNLGPEGKLEDEKLVTSTRFNQFKLLADQGLIKTRYVVDSTLEDKDVNFKFELDVFYNKRGELVPWVKIDAELPQGVELEPGDIPFKYEEIIIITPASKAANTGGINAKVGELYEKYFRTPNVHVEE